MDNLVFAELCQIKYAVHVVRDFLQASRVPAANFSSTPTMEIYLRERIVHISEIQITFTNFFEFTFSAGESFDVQFDDPLVELTNPPAHTAILPMIPDIKLHADQG